MDQKTIDNLRLRSISRQGNLINGKVSPSISGETIEVTSPIDGKALTTIPSQGKRMCI